jgi:hypothetical protein
MKKNRILITVMAILVALTISCEEFMETTPLGVASDQVFNTEKGVNALLTGAYAAIDGAGIDAGWFGTYAWSASVDNWVWGGVASDDAYKGSDVSDQTPINPIEQYETLPSNQYVSDKWIANYDGVSRCNDVLKVLAETDMDAAKAANIEAQAKFLRGWFHFEMKRVYNNIPYITEDVEDPGTVPNNVDAWPMIEQDLQFAVDNLPEEQAEVGRANKYAAMAVLARVHLFQQDWGAAKTLLDGIINSGKYQLVDEFHDNFTTATNNNAESIFEIQYAVNDGAGDSSNGGYGACLNFPQSGDIGVCCGFYQPTQNMVNAFKVDASGLPLLDTYNDTNLKNDMGVLSANTFVPFTDVVDPRLDWTVGRRGIPFLDHGIMRGADWIRDPGNGGPYLYLKNMFYASERGITTTTSGWATGVNANNYRAYRYSHVLLWRAEVAVEENDLATALDLVNQIRNRAKNSTPVMGLCTTYELPLGVAAVVDYNQPAANYMVEPYPSFPDQAYARKAVHFEMRLEFAMEGHRFFDLVRWGNAAQVLNDYIDKDSDFRSFLQGKSFTAGKDEYWPIPIVQIDIEGPGILEQNPGY